MKPGATTWPAASITRCASPRSPASTAATRSPSTATSARRAGPPVPSTTEPFRMSSDQVIDSPRRGLRLARPNHALSFEDPDRRHPVALLDAVHVLHAGDHVSEHGVVAVE